MRSDRDCGGTIDRREMRSRFRCVRACVRAFVRACVRACMSAPFASRRLHDWCRRVAACGHRNRGCSPRPARGERWRSLTLPARLFIRSLLRSFAVWAFAAAGLSRARRTHARAHALTHAWSGTKTHQTNQLYAAARVCAAQPGHAEHAVGARRRGPAVVRQRGRDHRRAGLHRACLRGVHAWNRTCLLACLLACGEILRACVQT
jgi:hypothetical protein